MQNQQARILEALDMLVRRDTTVDHHPNGSPIAGELVQTPDYSNTGTLGIARPGDLVPTRTVRYDFQKDAARFQSPDSTLVSGVWPVADRWVITYNEGPDKAHAILEQLVGWLVKPIGHLREVRSELVTRSH